MSKYRIIEKQRGFYIQYKTTLFLFITAWTYHFRHSKFPGSMTEENESDLVNPLETLESAKERINELKEEDRKEAEKIKTLNIYTV